jgi:hypothetical protein
MQILEELLVGEDFFTVSEIIFLVTDNADVDKAIMYFQTVMNESQFSNYVIHNTKAKVSFAEVFEYIIGISGNSSFKNSYNNVYRVERNSESNVAYVGTDNFDLSIEPFSYSKVNKYEENKELSKRTESGVYHHDNNSGVNVETFDNVKLGDLDFTNKIAETRVIVVTGAQKTGVSIWSAALAISALAFGNSVMLVDYTENRDIANLFTLTDVSLKQVSMYDLLHNYKASSTDINYVCSANQQEKAVQCEFIQHLFNSKTSLTNLCVIAIHDEELQGVLDVLHNDISDIVYCIHTIKSDVESKQRIISELSEQYRTSVILNDRLNLIDNSQEMPFITIKDALPDNTRVAQPINFDNLNLDGSLFSSLLMEV